MEGGAYMRVLQLYAEWPGLDGIGHHVRQLARHLTGLGIEVVLFTSGGQWASGTDEETMVFRARGWAAPLRMLSPGVLEAAGLLPLDLVHLHMPSTAGAVSWLLNLRSVPLVVSWHGGVFPRAKAKGLSGYMKGLLSRRVHGALLRAAAHLIAPTLPGELPPFLLSYAEKTSAIPYGVDLEALGEYEPLAVEAFRRAYGSPLLLSLSPFRSLEWVHHLLETVSLVPEGTLLLAGAGPRLAAARSAVRGRGLVHRVAFLGLVPYRRLLALYRAADLLFVPPEEEGEGLVPLVLEAQACGLPTMGLASGPARSWANLHEATGLTVPSLDPAAWAEAVSRLLSDSLLRRRLAAHAAERARGQLHARHVAEQLLEVYRAVLARKG
jgi:D-inositol-3-phosphate glycosyltransferase